ncbi:MAG: sulfur carrier protein ThiS [Veillonellaceae bacterium]|nr:sulfur carrier protein ThiS [Veillonellaceae bacterium]
MYWRGGDFISIVVNGEEIQLTKGSTVEQLLEQMGLKGRHLVIELNEQILTRQDWETVALQDGDRLEIVTFVGGG